jgi:hypothetical protein
MTHLLSPQASAAVVERLEEEGLLAKPLPTQSAADDLVLAWMEFGIGQRNTLPRVLTQYTKSQLQELSSAVVARWPSLQSLAKHFNSLSTRIGR